MDNNSSVSSVGYVRQHVKYHEHRTSRTEREATSNETMG